jgi:hypothetical protein
MNDDKNMIIYIDLYYPNNLLNLLIILLRLYRLRLGLINEEGILVWLTLYVRCRCIVEFLSYYIFELLLYYKY